MISEDLLKSSPFRLEQFLSPGSILQEIFDAIPVQIVIKSLRPADFGTFLLWNKKAEEVLGIPASEAIGKTDAAFFPEDQAGFFAEKDREVARGRVAVSIPHEIIGSRTLGLRSFATIKTPIFDQQDEAVALLSVSDDITDRIRTDEELRRTLEFLQKMNNALPGALFQFKVDLDGRPSFSYVSEGVLKITEGPALTDIEDDGNFLSSIVPEDLPGYLSAVAKSRRDMSTCRHEFRISTISGAVRWVMATSSPVDQPDGSTLWHGFLTDVSEQKKTSEAFWRSEERLHHALNAMRAAVWELDLETGQLFLSPEWGEVTGFPPETYPTTLEGLLSFVHRDDQFAVDSLRRMEENAWTGQIEYRHRLATSSYAWVLLSGKPVYDDHGTFIRQVGTILDISHRKRMENQLVEAKESAERASQAKGDFLAMMSHEIRTPLNAILGFSELLGGTHLSSEQSGFLQTIQDSSSALLVVLNDVLDYSKIESGKLDLFLVPTEISKVIRSSVDIFRLQAATRGVKLNAVFTGNIPQYLLCDAARLSQVIHNLLSNAVKFTEKGEIWVELTSEGGGADGFWPINLKVRDTGIGIDLTQHTSLFDPFYQADSSTRRRRGGTGLGLAIVRRLISLMNGHISVDSAPGKGTSFCINLPLQLPEKDEPLDEDEQKRVSINLGSVFKRILIVEDNATNRKLLKLFLKKLGYDADEADSGFAGVEMASHKAYDVIFMDLEMPGMDGYESTRNIRSQGRVPGPYIVALTAHAMPEYRQRSFEAGMQAYLSKPVKKDEIAKILRDVFKR